MRKLSCRVILFPQPFIGHLTPMLHLAHALHSKGFSISIITTRFNAPDPARYPDDFTFHFIQDGLSESESPTSDTWEMWVCLNRSCLDPFRAALGRVLEESEEKVGCLISDPMWDFAATVADEFGLPRMAMRPGGMLAFLVYDSIPLLREKGYFPVQDAQLEEAVEELPPLKKKNLPTIQHDALAQLAKSTRTYSQGIICNTFMELESSILHRVSQNLHNIPLFPVGPLHKYSPTTIGSVKNTEDPSCINWLNTQLPNSVLYVSFGSLVPVTKHDFVEIAWGLADSNQPFLWVVRPNMVNGSDHDPFPDDFLDEVVGRGRIVRWAPQERVLGHSAVGGFWTHCGWNSTMESICEGVPMICFPVFADQTMNAKVITDVLGVGLQLEKGLKRGEIESVVRRVMVGEEGREMRERVGILKEKARCSLGGKGSSYECLNKLTSHILSLSNNAK